MTTDVATEFIEFISCCAVVKAVIRSFQIVGNQDAIGIGLIVNSFYWMSMLRYSCELQQAS